MRLGTSELAAHALDQAAAKIARSRGMIELAVGEALARLFDTRGLVRLGYSRQVDYSRERLGIPPRTMYGWVRLARSVAGRPLLRRAVQEGVVTPRKALVVAPLASGEDEQEWVETATRLPFTELKRLVQASAPMRERCSPLDEYGNVESLILRMTPEQQERLDEAIALARSQSNQAVPRWQCVEHICQEWLGTFGAWEPALTELAADAIAPPTQSVARHLQAVRTALRPLTEYVSPIELDAQIQELLAGRHNFDLAFGEVAAQVSSRRLWTQLGYARFEDYCRDRLGVAPRSFRERVWLERRMCALPPLRKALESGELTYSKALLVAKDAKPRDVDERIADAAERTWQHIERESTEAERRRNLARGIRRVWGPEDTVRTVAIAIASAKSVMEAAGLGVVDSGEALALIAGHFLRVWEAHKKRGPSRRRREVFMREGGLCAVPGCSRAAQHEHHIRFRSRGGTDDAANLIGLCAVHHLQGVHGSSGTHRGNLRVSGRGGEKIDWQFGNGERWVTVGRDSVYSLARHNDGNRRRRRPVEALGA